VTLPRTRLPAACPKPVHDETSESIAGKNFQAKDLCRICSQLQTKSLLKYRMHADPLKQVHNLLFGFVSSRSWLSSHPGNIRRTIPGNLSCETCQSLLCFGRVRALQANFKPLEDLIHEFPTELADGHLVNRYVNAPGENQAENLNGTRTLCSSITYSCLRFDRMSPTEYNSNSLFNLPLDRIGILHPDIGASACSLISLKYVGSPVLSFDFWSAGSSTTHDS